MIKLVILELCKVFQFSVIWSIPLLLAKYTNNYWFLLLLIVSLLLNYKLWNHYEYIITLIFRKRDEGKNSKQEPNEER